MSSNGVLSLFSKLYYPSIQHVMSGGAGVFLTLSGMYRRRRFLQNDEPSAVFWFDHSLTCLDERWSVSAIPWKRAKQSPRWSCLTLLPEKAGKALHEALIKTIVEQRYRETVIFLDTLGIIFENHFWLIPLKPGKVMAIMRQRPFCQEKDLGG